MPSTYFFSRVGRIIGQLKPVKERHVSEVNAHDRFGVITREHLGDRASPIAAVRREATDPQLLRHQPVPQIANAEDHPVLVGRIRESITRQTRHDHLERVGRVGAVARGVGEHRDQLRESQKGIREAVGQNDRQRIWTATGLVNEVQAFTVELRLEMREAVHCRFLGAPIELVPPIGHELAHVRDVETERPTAVAKVFNPSRTSETPTEVVEHIVWSRDLERPGTPSRAACIEQGVVHSSHGQSPPREAQIACQLPQRTW